MSYLTVLHHVLIVQPCLVKRSTCRVDNMTKSIPLCKNKHGIQETFHGVRGLGKLWSVCAHKLAGDTEGRGVNYIL